MNLLLIFTCYYKYLNYENVYNLGNKTVLYLICNRINGFVRDIADKLLGKTRLYADDTSLSYSSSELAQIEIVLNNHLKMKELTKWLIDFNPAKTEVVLVSNIFMIMTYG